MNDTRPPQIKPHHLQRLAVVYLRQSTLKQVEQNTGSTAYQRNQKVYALQWGWPEADILVIDEDLGLSGGSGAHRHGWQRLLKLVSDERVGIIFASDISRLSRSFRDFFTLVEVCTEFAVLLAVDGKIVQFDDPHDAFMANIRAAFGQYDNAVRKNTFANGKLARVQDGLAVTLCPTGYVVSEKGRWVKDPDAAVRQTIVEVFRRYQALGTLGQVLKFFNDHGLKLPIRRGAKLPCWRPPTLSRIYRILTNPAFAGDYSFGRRPSVGGGLKDRHRADGEHRITITGHHEPYVSPTEWQQIQERLRSNLVGVRQPAGPGPALCQGLVRCGRCGRPMGTAYFRRPRKVGIRYLCNQARRQYGAPVCWSVNGRRLDEVVAAALLQGLVPPEMEAVIAAAGDTNAGFEAARRQRQVELDRVRYEADLAERRFKLVDPANRLVAASLEHDWQVAQERLREVERRQTETPLAPPLEVTPESLEAIRSLAVDLPALWAAPSTTDQDRKLVIRLLVQEIRVTAISDVDFEVEIAWVGGATTQHRIAQPFAGGVIARRLAAQGMNEDQIAAELNRRGLRTVFKGGAYTATSLRRVLEYHARKAGAVKVPWPVYREQLRAPLTELVQAGWSDAAIAAEFNRRGLRSFSSRKPWNGQKVRHLRHLLGIQSVPSPRVRATRPSRIAAEALRAPLAELVQAAWSDAAIAAEFNRRDLPKWGYRATWDKTRVYNLRHSLGIQSVIGVRVRERKSLPMLSAKGDSDAQDRPPDPEGTGAGRAFESPRENQVSAPPGPVSASTKAIR